MAKTNIGAAFGMLVRTNGDAAGLRLAARIACHLTDLAPSAVRSIDSDLSFSVKSIGLQPSMGDSVRTRIDHRRASTLIQKTVQPLVAAPANFDVNLHDAYISTAKTAPANAAYPVRIGAYLGGSYWAYSEHNHRVKTRTAWTEAARLVQAGLDVVNHPAVTANANLYRRWFGTAPAATVLNVLTLTSNGLGTSCTGIGYAHQATAGNPLNLTENGFAGDGRAEAVGPGANWGNAQFSNQRRFMCLETLFFDDAETGGLPNALHGLTDLRAMEVSRGGAVLHESTHLFANTMDVPLSTVAVDMYAVLGVARTPANANARAYGPMACAALATHSPAQAANNADSYRLFCEDAFTL